MQERRRRAWLGAVVGVAGIAGSYLIGGPLPGSTDLAFLGIAGVGVVATVVARVAAERAWVAAQLDGSRRWVTLTGVHPFFAAAVAEHQRLHRGASPR